MSDLKRDSEPTQAAHSGGPPTKHTSIIYFHGMGTPKRYEELSRVLDTLDRYAEAQPEARYGVLRGQKVGLEGSRVGAEEPIAFIQFARFLRAPGRRTKRVGLFRLYESYWSPAAAGGLSAVAVLGWVLLRALNPLAVLARPWRAHQRLKLTYLNRLFYDRGAIPARRFAQLATLYREFEGMDARRSYPSGRFANFQQMIRDRINGDARACEDLLRISETWKRSLTAAQLQVVLFAATVAAALFGVMTLVAYLAAFGLGFVAPHFGVLTSLTERARGVPRWVAAAATLVFVGVALMAAFMRNFLADVVFWTTTLEKDVRYRKRREILRACSDSMLHVLNDPNCDRIVVVAHSLGTAIAYETLLGLGRRAAAERRDRAGMSALEGSLRKISHVVTFGSPIDRIAYFFNLTFSRYHRFNRVADTLFGSTSDAPFRFGRERVIHWLNIRDAADPISSRLFSPRGVIPNRDEIQEIEVVSSHVPNPAKAHTGYFSAYLGAKLLFDACVLNLQQTQVQQERSKASKKWTTVARGAVWVSSFVAAWAMGAGAWGFWWAKPLLMTSAQFTILAAVVVVACVALIGTIWDRIERLSLPA